MPPRPRSKRQYKKWQRLYEARIAARMTRRQLAEAAGREYTYVCQLEQGRAGGRDETLFRLADALRIDVNELIRTRPNPPPRGSTSTRTGAA